GRAPDAAEGEVGRDLFIVRSSDDGKSFSTEKPATSKKLGACACCGMRAFADERGAVYILYRPATETTERGETLLVSPKPGADFQVSFAHPWNATICPMSSTTLAPAKGGAVGTWETGKEVFFARFNPNTLETSRPVSPPTSGVSRKHPVAVTNSSGETLF